MYERAEELRIHEKFGQLSRLKNLKSKLTEKKLSSSALGDNVYHIIPMPGRITMDLMKSVQGNASFNLESYSLDSVSSTFMRGDVSDIKRDISYNRTQMTTNKMLDLQEDSFVTFVVNDGIMEFPFEDGRKFRVTRIDGHTFDVEGDIHFDTARGHKYQWCESKDNISIKQLFASEHGSPQDRAVVAKYCLQDCLLVGRLMDQLDIITNNIAMANVCCVPLSYLFLRGQGVKVLSLVSRQTKKEGFLLPVNKVHVPDADEDLDDETREGYEGAIVLEPQCDIHYDPVAVSDFASLLSAHSQPLFTIIQKCHLTLLELHIFWHFAVSHHKCPHESSCRI